MKTNYVLIDYENVSPDNLDLLNQEWIRVLLFVGKNQTRIPISLAKSMQKMGTRAQYVEMAGTGHNALDFHIAYYIGRISAREEDVFFHIISNDQGFDPLITHLKAEKVFCDRVIDVQSIPLVQQSMMVDKSLEERIVFVKERIGKAHANRPRSRKTLVSHVGAMFAKTLSEKDVTDVVEALFAERFVVENGKRLEYACEKMESTVVEETE